jgi:hypothetical protein
LKKKKCFSIRELAQVIGLLVAAFPAVFWGPLFYRQLEDLKIVSLKTNKGDYEKTVKLTNEAEQDLDWWLSEGLKSNYPLCIPKISVNMTTDASNEGFGATCNSKQTQGRWNTEEKDMHINCLELLAIKYALLAFRAEVKGKHVSILCDNSCAVSYIKNKGGSKSRICNLIAKDIWLWCKQKQVWITISYLPGKLNIQADIMSRKFNDRTEWMLNRNIFDKICSKVYQPNVDLFASRLNYQLKPFISWLPDPDALAIDAFTMNWQGWLIYCFPPFSLVQRCLRKLIDDQAEGVMVVPCWTTAVWFPLLLRLLTQAPVLLPKGKQTLQLPHSNSLHPLHSKLQLLACVCSANLSKQKAFRDRLPKLSSLHGEIALRNSTHPIWQDGNHFVIEEKLIHCERL